jgi:hypothetical protein
MYLLAWLFVCSTRADGSMRSVHSTARKSIESDHTRMSLAGAPSELVAWPNMAVACRRNITQEPLHEHGDQPWLAGHGAREKVGSRRQESVNRGCVLVYTHLQSEGDQPLLVTVRVARAHGRVFCWHRDHDNETTSAMGAVHGV